MRTIITLIAFASLTCVSTPKTSDRVSPPLPQGQLLRVFKGQQLTMQLTPDSRILSGSGELLGEFDSRSRRVNVGKVEISLDQVVREQTSEGFELALPVGPWRIDVGTAGEVTVPAFTPTKPR